MVHDNQQLNNYQQTKCEWLLAMADKQQYGKINFTLTNYPQTNPYKLEHNLGVP